MSTSIPKRTRTERVQSLSLPPGRFQILGEQFRHAPIWIRLGLATIAAFLMIGICQAWKPPFIYRSGYIPARDLVARVTFEVPDPDKTRNLQEQRRRETVVYYENRPQALNQRRDALRDQLFLVLGASSLDQLGADGRNAWQGFYEFDETAAPDAELMAFAAVKATFVDDPELKILDEAVRNALQPLTERGLLVSLGHTLDNGDQGVINVFPPGNPELAKPVDVEQVRIATVRTDLIKRLNDEIVRRFPASQASTAAKLVTRWMVQELPQTLTYKPELSEEARRKAAEMVQEVMVPYTAGVSSLAPARTPLKPDRLNLLRYEWQQVLASLTLWDKSLRVAAYFGMIMAMYLLVGSYIYFVDDRNIIMEPIHLTRLLGLAVLTVATCQFASHEEWQSEVIPLVMAAIIAAIAYGRELALVFSAALCLGTTLFMGQDLCDLVALAAASLSCILFLGRIRSRSRLLLVGGGSAAVAAATVIGVGIVTGQTLAGGQSGALTESVVDGLTMDGLLGILLREAGWMAGCTVVAALSMTGLLPVVEKAFGVQTDLSLLELGDASHPLLRQLAQRAPGTYNHSINVASIAEAAADKIGANGLLVRVGAYFHDIGKMFKPDYFIENQGQGPNQHDSLQPAMSTLVIIAHVKDGADLARSHHLPEPIIDFILQHHGTTLVEYFYRQATKKSEEDPNGEFVSDSDFRYPGPKPQTLEAAVLMLADTVESASRALVDPTPARIASLVDSIAMKKLTDRQFDECGLTLLQLDTIKQSLVKSLTAIYHARVKYPGQQSA
jgi:putative nucleotidyltransferase with HDIG domain